MSELEGTARKKSTHTTWGSDVGVCFCVQYDYGSAAYGCDLPRLMNILLRRVEGVPSPKLTFVRRSYFLLAGEMVRKGNVTSPQCWLHLSCFRTPCVNEELEVTH